jgi:hypothetical protein
MDVVEFFVNVLHAKIIQVRIISKMKSKNHPEKMDKTVQVIIGRILMWLAYFAVQMEVSLIFNLG